MNYGRYFVLDHEASDLSRRITVFNYRGVKYLKTDYKPKTPQDSATDTPKYPFYIAITQEGVSFYVHYANYLKEGNEKSLLHINNEILFLPISGVDTKGVLSDILNNCYDTTFPTNHEEAFLYNLVSTCLMNEDEEHKGITYSSLEVFDMDRDNPKGENRPHIINFVRKLFLDFLFDMDHSKVFHNSVYYTNVHIGLNENFLFKAIRCKADYYYKRKQMNVEKEPEVHPYDKAGQTILEAAAYSLAEERWVYIITRPEAEKTFHNSDWFSTVEDEMDRIFVSEPLKNTNKKARNSTDNTTNKKTESCNDLVSQIKYKKEYSKTYENNKVNLKKIKQRIKDTARQASGWYVRKYNLRGIMRIWYGKNYWLGYLFIILSLGIFISGLFIKFDDTHQFKYQLILQFSILASIPILWFIIGSIGRRRFVMKTGGINALMPRLFASIVAAWFTLAIGEDIFKGFFDNNFGKITSIGISIILFVFVIHEITKLNPFIGLAQKIERTIMLLVIAFTYSYLSGLLIVQFFGAKYIERSDYIAEFYTNHIYVQNPDYCINNSEEFVHESFYAYVQKHDSVLMKKIKILVHDNCEKIDTAIIKAFGTQSYKVTHKQKVNNDFEIAYGATLILVDAFKTESSDYLNELHHHMLEGSIVKLRLNNVWHQVEMITKDSLSNSYFSNFYYKDSHNLENAWIDLLKSIDNTILYQDALKRIGKKGCETILKQARFGIYNILVFNNLLSQFTFFAMFIGIFLQLIFEEKNVTEPL